MSTCCIGRIVRVIATVMIVLTLIVGCGRTEPTATPVPPTDTPKPTATSQPTNTSTPTGTPSFAATHVPTDTPAPTATAMSTEAPTPTPYPEPVARAGVKTYGRPYNDSAFDILLTADGGTLIAGLANNTHRSHRITPGNARLIKTDLEGTIIWEKDYGGEDDAFFSSIIRAGEEEYVLLGEIASSYIRNETDLYLVKVNGEGNEIWSHTYGGRGMDLGKMVRQTADGGYILIGDTADEFPTRTVYQSKLCLIKTDAEGNEVWSQTYGDQILYLGWAVAQTPDGGYVLTGWEAKTIDDRDVIAIKTNEMGDVEWSRTWDLGPGERDGGFDLILTSDGYIVIACIQSMGSGAPSAVLLKVDLDGNEMWNKLIGDEGVGNTFWHIMEDSDGGYVMVGDTHLGKVPGSGKDIHGGLMIKTDADGEILWQRIFGEGEYEQVSFNSAALLPTGGYVFVGKVTRYGERYSDMLWLKTRHEVIAFTSERDGNSEIYTMNADGSDPQRLTDDPAYDAWPTWSPDGAQIAFCSDRSGNPDIYIMDADGSNLRQLTHHSANDIWPEWSPDGARIAFPSRRDGNFEIYVVNVDGTNLQRLTNTPDAEDFPAWSPDSSQIVFSSIEGNEGTYIMNADGGDRRQLTDIVALEPAWSPDGTRIAFASDHEGFRGIYVMDADGSNLHKLSNARAGENCPAWSPDGTRIAFASWRDGDGEIYLMDVADALQGTDGSNLQKLTDNRFEEEFPAWRPMTAVAPAVESPAPMLYPDLAARADVRTYGGEYNDWGYDILLLDDGGTLIVGRANNTHLSHRIMPGKARLIRTDAEGNVIWEKDYGGEVDSMFYSPIQVREEEYVVLGAIAASYDRNEDDMYLVKIDGEGNEIWSHTYGGRGLDTAGMVRQTADGGFILIGGRSDEFPTGNLYQGNIVLIKTDAEGNEVWSQTYGDEILYMGCGGSLRHPMAGMFSPVGRPRPSPIGTSSPSKPTRRAMSSGPAPGILILETETGDSI